MTGAGRASTSRRRNAAARAFNTRPCGRPTDSVRQKSAWSDRGVHRRCNKWHSPSDLFPMWPYPGWSASEGSRSLPTELLGPEAVTAAVTTVDAFGVSAEQWELIEGNLFGASLLPYLVFLYYLGMPESKMPPRALFGFKFLLVFVFGTIPCAIYAKLVYNDILANVDWLHGPAESLLTITNLLIVIGEGGAEGREGQRRGKRSKVSSGAARSGLERGGHHGDARGGRGGERAGALGTSRRRRSRRRPLPLPWATWRRRSSDTPSPPTRYRCPPGSFTSLVLSSGWWPWV